MDYGCKLYNTASIGRLKKFNSIHKEGIRIYTGSFKTSPEGSMHIKAYVLPLELRK